MRKINKIQKALKKRIKSKEEQYGGIINWIKE